MPADALAPCAMSSLAMVLTKWDKQVLFFLMMMPSNGNIFLVTGPLCGEFTGHRWFETPSCSLWRHCNAWGGIFDMNLFPNKEWYGMERHISQNSSACKVLTLHVLKPEYCRSIPWVLMPWLLPLPGQQYPWNLLGKINMRMDFNSAHPIVEKITENTDVFLCFLKKIIPNIKA